MTFCRDVESHKITIVIPTYNRPNDLLRLIKFLQILGNHFPIVILDSSKDKIKKINQEICRVDNITYRAFSENYHFGLKIKDCLNESINSQYIIFCADDDFVIPAAIAKAALFLDTHLDYSAVTGIAKCLAYPKKMSDWGLFTFLNDLKNPLILDEKTFLARYLKLIAFYQVGCPPLFYGLRRTEQVKEIFNNIPGTFKYSSLEILNNSLTLLWGKSITLPYLMTIRNYSSEPTIDINRQNNDYYLCPVDVEHIRMVLAQEMKKMPNEMSDEIITYTLDQFIGLPLEKLSERYQIPVIQTDLVRKLAYKKNWFFYVINYIFPYFNEKFDVTLKKEIVVALKKAFSSKIKPSLAVS